MLRFLPSTSLLTARFLTLIIAFTLHEFSHAVTAVALGDDSPRRDGRLSLNPLRHLDWWGVIMLLTMGYGWAKPVRVNRYAVNRRTKAGLMLVSLAGPLSNFLMAAAAAFIYTRGLYPAAMPAAMSWIPTPRVFLLQFIQINLNLMVFNLLPIAPLDGEKVFSFFVPGAMKNSWNQLQRYGRRILMLLFFLLPYAGYDFAGEAVYKITNSLYTILLGGIR